MGDRLYMAASVLIRMGAGLLVFVLMARGLGPTAYGLVATVFAYATLASLLTDFGFASKTLRDIGADRDNGGAILNASLNVKILLTVVVSLVGGVVIAFLPGDPVTRLAAALMGFAILTGTIGDLSLMAYRAVGRFRSETWLTLWTSGLHLAAIGWISIVHGDLLILAIAFAVSRLIYTTIAVIGAERIFPGSRLHFRSPTDLWASIRASWGWAADSGLGYLSGQIDGLIVASIFGLQTAGVYQSGARFIQAALALVTILASIHIPRVARRALVDKQISKDEQLMMLEFTGVGVLIGLVIWLGGPLATHFLLGAAYSEVNALWAGFAVFVAVRYMSASLGASLSGLGMALSRVAGQLSALAVIGICCVALLPQAGVKVVPWIMSLGAAVTLAANLVSRVLAARGHLAKTDWDHPQTNKNETF